MLITDAGSFVTYLNGNELGPGAAGLHTQRRKHDHHVRERSTGPIPTQTCRAAEDQS